MTIACHTFRRELAACLRGRSDITSLGWHEHLLACADCRALLEVEQALEALLASLPAPRLPVALAERVLARLEGARVGAASEPGDRLELLLGRVPMPEPPPELAARLLARLAAARRRPARRFTPALRALAAGLVLAGAAAAWWLAFGRRETTPTPPEVVQTPPAPAEAAAPDPELLAALELLQSWELVTDDDLDLMLSSLEATDEALLESEPQTQPAEGETPRRNG
jgi:hypothetical protein